MSMTMEGARKQLEELFEYCENMKVDGEIQTWERDCEAIKMAISALRPVSREQVEKVWRGEWVLVRRMAASIECKCPKCQRMAIFAGRPANFCEKCGSANTDEAVDIVMERLEVLKDGKDD